MIQSLYSGAAALDVIAKQQDLISSNLANLNTSGHRKAQFAVSSRVNPNSESAVKDSGPAVSEQKLDFTNGRLHRTGSALDVSIVGDAFFVFDSPDGDVYSRGGNLHRDPESGLLTNNEGMAVQGDAGPITLPFNVGIQDFFIDADGTISAGGNEIGKLSLVSFADNDALIPVSQSVFKAGDQAEIVDSAAVVSQFHQEYSNANPVSELVALIVGTRQYEAVQKVSTAIAEALRDHIRA